MAKGHKKSTLVQENLEDFLMILSEMERIYIELAEKQLNEIDGDDFLFEIYWPEKDRNLSIGRKAAESFWRIASRTIDKTEGLRGRATANEFAKTLQRNFVSFVIERDESLSSSTVEKIVNASSRYFKKAYPSSSGPTKC